MERRITMITLGVTELETASLFYEQHFGWTRTAASNDDIVFYQLNGMQLALYPIEKLAEDAQLPGAGIGFKGFSLAYNTRSENEVDTLFRSFEQAGVRIVKSPEKVFWGGYSGYIADPDGHLWEIAYNPFLSLDEKGAVQGD